MRVFITATILIFLFILSPAKTYSQSPYTLPYPSTMPGSIFYKAHFVIEKVSKIWYFGNFGQFNYNLKYSDKYLVEAKTLFEYKQYLLAFDALGKSDNYFKNIKPSLLNAKKENKDISEKTIILKNASQKHIEILSRIKENVPDVFDWIPENSSPTKLYLKKSLTNSISIRSKNL